MDEISPGLARMIDETPITDNHSPEPVVGGISPYLSRDLSCTTEVISFIVCPRLMTTIKSIKLFGLEQQFIGSSTAPRG